MGKTHPRAHSLTGSAHACQFSHPVILVFLIAVRQTVIVPKRKSETQKRRSSVSVWDSTRLVGTIPGKSVAKACNAELPTLVGPPIVCVLLTVEREMFVRLATPTLSAIGN